MMENLNDIKHSLSFPQKAAVVAAWVKAMIRHKDVKMQFPQQWQIYTAAIVKYKFKPNIISKLSKT